MLDALLAAAVFATSILSGILGMAGGLVLMGVLTAAVPVTSAMVLHAVAQATANGVRAGVLVRHIYVRGLAIYAVGAGVSFAALSLVRFVPAPAVVYFGLGIVPFIGAAVVRWEWARTRLVFSHPIGAFTCGMLVGGVQLVAGVAGPLLDVYFVNDKGLDRHAIVATKAATQTMSHLLKLAYFLPLLGDPRDAAPIRIGAAMIAAVVGTWIGTRILHRLDDATFRLASRWVVLAIGAFYLLRWASLLLQAG